MTATLAEKKTTKAQRLEEFKRDYICPFSWTVKKPLDLHEFEKQDKRPTSDDVIKNLPTLSEYIKNRQTPVVYGEYDVVKLDNDETPVADVNGFCTIEVELLFINRENGFTYRSEEGVPNVCLTYSSKDYLSSGKGFDKEYVFDDDNAPALDDFPGALLTGNLLLINADEGAAVLDFVGCGLYDDRPCVSFDCLVNLTQNKVITLISAKEKILSSSKIEIVAFSPAETRDISDKLYISLTKARKTKSFQFTVWAANQTPPSLGFSLVNGNPTKWHKSATVLIRNGKTSYLLGQDEGTYFGCILADNPKTIEDAYLSLMPKEARGVKGVLRQGEWFAIPVKDQKSVPPEFSRDIIFSSCDDHDGSLCFGLEDRESNHHHFMGNLIVTKDGRYFAQNFTIEHDEHVPLSGQQNVWYTFARNTAVASFSAEKVD